MEETETKRVNALIKALTTQRNNALNDHVNVSAELELAQETIVQANEVIKKYQEELKELRETLTASKQEVKVPEDSKLIELENIPD